MERSDRPTILDVASRAGVSKSLVSLVMRGAPNVSDQKRAAVLAAAEELGYRPNLVARSLVERRSRHLGVMISDFHNPFFADLVSGLEEGAHAEGYRLVMNTGRRVTAQEESAIEALIELQVDGLVLAGARVPMRVIAAVAEFLPVILVSRSSRKPNVDVIVNDDRAGSALAVDHLVQLGHRRIAHIDGGDGANAAPRRRAYEAAMRRHRLESEIINVRAAFTAEAGAEGAHELSRLRRPPTAIFACNDRAAIGALGALSQRGVRVPEDMSVVGYDGIATGSLPQIDLTTVAQPRYEMGRSAVGLILERIRGQRAEARRVVLPPQLVVRGTTAPPPRLRRRSG
jgi:DNA-binding LacI/PurR family transcriptional regulator